MENLIYQKSKEVEALIAKNDTELAIIVLLEFLKADDNFYFLYEDVLLISNRYYDFVRSYHNGTLSDKTNLTRINHAILGILRKLKEQHGETQKRTNSSKLSAIFKSYVLAKNEEEINKAKFDMKLLKEKQPDDYEVEKMSKIILNDENPENEKNQRHRDRDLYDYYEYLGRERGNCLVNILALFIIIMSFIAFYVKLFQI